MLAVERIRQIELRVKQDGSARVAELARIFNVTEETIRRDLEKLESQHKIIRSHGGAASIGDSTGEVPYFEREERQVNEKVAVARTAVQRINEGDTLFIDASSTALQLAKTLPDIKLTVLTNAVKVMLELSQRPRIRVISTGGTLASESLSFYGPSAEKFLEGFHVDKIFVSCKGLDLERGASESSEMLAAFKRRAIAFSDWRCLLVDHTKLGANALAVFANLSDFHEIITDKKADADSLKDLRRLVKTVTAA